jgi:predicted ATPase
MAKEKKKSGPTLSVSNLAQIREGTVEFGDLTLVVGAQASGKSVFLQLLKLLIDRRQIFDMMELHALNWSGQFNRMLDLYFGESMSGIWRAETKVTLDKTSFGPENLQSRKGSRESTREEKMFYVPAQRVVTMAQGWPRPFSSFELGDPYVIKSFSETLRVLMEKESSNGQGDKGIIFPKSGRIHKSIRDQIDSCIFHGASVEIDTSSLRKRFLLHVGESNLPFMTWSAGQKEFMPLLLSLYHLIVPAKVSTRDRIEWVVIEEPEMGLHPQAIQTVMLLCLELISRGYKVVMSTHSPVLLELVWAVHNIKEVNGSPDVLYELFSLKKAAFPGDFFKKAIEEKVFKSYYFQRQDDGVHIKDISTLDAGSDDPAISNWGGLIEFAGRAAEVVSKLPEK